jgi:hypothetical protein
VIHADHRHGTGDCPQCGRFVDLDRGGCYRRHYSAGLDGFRGLCPASGERHAGVVQLLGVEPTVEERYSHALRLLHG